MHIVCPTFHVIVGGEDINIADGRAVCRPCREVFVLPSWATDVPRSLLPRPASMNWMELSPTENALFVATHTSGGLGGLVTLVFAVVWDGFLVNWYSNVGVTDFGFWFTLLHVAAGVCITHQALCQLFNRTQFVFERDKFVCRSGPLPTFCNVSEATANIDRFYSEVKSTRRSTYTIVKMLTRDGRSHRVPGSYEHDEAVFVADKLTRVLGRVNAPKTYRG